jgi:Protein of unknown function (DUF3987)
VCSVTAPGIKEVVDAAQQGQVEPPRPLLRDLPPAEPFPLAALGDILGGAAEAIVDRVQCPDATTGQSVLGAATLATQGHANVELPHGRCAPLSNYYVTVDESGGRKSEADRHALWPIRRREEALRAAHDLDLPLYEQHREAWEAQRRQILRAQGKGAAKTLEDKKAELNALGPAPHSPLIPLLTCPEPTFEGLCRLLAGGHPSVGVFSAEGGQFIGGHGMSEDNRLKTAAAMSSLWDGEAVRRVRAGDGITILPGRRVAAHLMLQPGVAIGLLADATLIDQGLLSRVLASHPDSLAGLRLWRDPRPESETKLKRYGVRLLSILEAPLPLAPGKHNELVLPALCLSPEARRLLIQFGDHVERSLAKGGLFDSIRPLANKLGEHAARLAAVLTLVEDLHARRVPAECTEAGISLAEHYAAEAQRLAGADAASPDLWLAERLRLWLLTEWNRGPIVSLVDIYQFGPNPIGDAATARKMVGLLEEHGWLIRVQGGAVVNNVPRRECWRIITGG